MVLKGRTAKGILASFLVVTLTTGAWLIYDTKDADAAGRGTISSYYGVNVRRGSSTSTSIVKAASKGTSFNIYSEKFTSNSNSADTIWYETSLGGYVRSDLVSADFNTESGYATDYLNGRSGAGTNFPARYLFRPKEPVQIMTKAYDVNGNLWYKIRHGSGYVYAYGAYIQTGNSTPKVEPKPEVKKPEPVQPPKAPETKVEEPKKADTPVAPSVPKDPPKKPEVQKETPKTTKKITKTITETPNVNTVKENGVLDKYTDVNVRSGIGTGTSIVATIKEGVTFIVESEHFTSARNSSKSNIWSKTSLNGYVRSDLITVRPGTSIRGIVTDNLNGRSGAGIGHGIITVLRKSSEVDILLKAYDTNGNLWYKVNASGREMYVSSDFVKVKDIVKTIEVEVPVAPETKPAEPNKENPSNGSDSTPKADKPKDKSEPPKQSEDNTKVDNSNKPAEPKKPESSSEPKKPAQPEKHAAPAGPPAVRNANAQIDATDGVNLRRGPSTGASIIKGLGHRTPFQVINEKFVHATDYRPENIWLNTNLGGYIRSDLAIVSYDTTKGKTTDYLKARVGAGMNFPVKKVLSPNTEVEIVTKSLDTSDVLWYKIKDGSSYLYVNGEYVVDGGQQETQSATPSTNGNGVGTVAPPPMTDQEFEAHLIAQGFPESYKPYLRSLHKEHPNWIFNSKHVGMDWNTALNRQVLSSNLVYYTHPAGYKDVNIDSYDFNTGRYIGKDGNAFIKASDTAVGYYMDPRNFLNNSGIFMFEDLQYNEKYQTEDIVKRILVPTSIPQSASRYFMEAASMTVDGRSYSVSPVYLASKARAEIGNTTFVIDGHEFYYGGVKFKGYYNPFNIGAFDSPDGSAATKGLVFAAGGLTKSNTSYLRPWNTLEKSIKGGAIFVAKDFIANNQNTMYYERFNVKNGLGSVGTHQYMTAVYAPANQAQTVYNSYNSFGISDIPFVFEIPVYSNMPESPSKAPGYGDNNVFLDGITISDGTRTYNFTTYFNRFVEDYTLNGTIPGYKNTVTIKGIPNSRTTTVQGDGVVTLQDGNNLITLTVTSASGKEKTYRINILKASSSGFRSVMGDNAPSLENYKSMELLEEKPEVTETE